MTSVSLIVAIRSTVHCYPLNRPPEDGLEKSLPLIRATDFINARETPIPSYRSKPDGMSQACVVYSPEAGILFVIDISPTIRRRHFVGRS
jgi:hypothetical protein